MKNSTNNLAIYSELGRFPLYILRHIRLIKYWLKLFIEKQDNCILHKVAVYQRNSVHDLGINNWSFKIKGILETAGFADVWMYPESVNINLFIPIFQVRLRDIYICKWRSDMSLCSSLVLYKELKNSFTISEYLVMINDYKTRNMISKIRLSSHKLRIETGRHMNIERQHRKCQKCNLNDIQDEYHFILICPYLKTLRIRYISKYYTENPSMYKFINLLNSCKVKEIVNLSNFCIKAFKKLEL